MIRTIPKEVSDEFWRWYFFLRLIFQILCSVLLNFGPFFVLAAYSDTDTVTNPDDLLPPLEKLQKYADSENIFNR